MKKKPVLVELDRLRSLIAALELGDKKRNDYLDARWVKYIEWWDSRSRDAKWRHQSLRAVVVIAGALIPALVGVRELMIEHKRWGMLFAILSILASVVVAICAGLESLYNYGGIWREKRAAAELIKSEGFSFLQLAGKYKDYATHAAAYKTFASNVEELISSEIKDYIVAVSPTTSDRKDQDGQNRPG